VKRRRRPMVDKVRNLSHNLRGKVKAVLEVAGW
jgi:hypothetical protein